MHRCRACNAIATHAPQALVGSRSGQTNPEDESSHSSEIRQVGQCCGGRFSQSAELIALQSEHGDSPGPRGHNDSRAIQILGHQDAGHRQSHASNRARSRAFIAHLRARPDHSSAKGRPHTTHDVKSGTHSKGTRKIMAGEGASSRRHRQELHGQVTGQAGSSATSDQLCCTAFAANSSGSFSTSNTPCFTATSPDSRTTTAVSVPNGGYLYLACTNLGANSFTKLWSVSWN
jgi:hypothetical protein